MNRGEPPRLHGPQNRALSYAISYNLWLAEQERLAEEENERRRCASGIQPDVRTEEAVRGPVGVAETEQQVPEPVPVPGDHVG